MTIQEWFDTSGSFWDGVELYSRLPNAKKNLLRSFKVESFSNMLMLKYELKTALNKGMEVAVQKAEKAPVIPPEPLPEKDAAVPLKFIIEEANKNEFAKETMAMYPIDLHPVYRERISNFYMACELKFKLNRTPAEDDKAALDLILQLEKLWSKIDKAWMVLDYWKENNRLMPLAESTDFSKLSPIQLQKEIFLLDTRISKRKKTIVGIEKYLAVNPDDKTKTNLYHKKIEGLEQLQIDLETIKKLINE